MSLGSVTRPMRLIGPLRRPLWLAAAVGEGVLEVALTVVREARAALEEVSAEEPVGSPSEERWAAEPDASVEAAEPPVRVPVTRPEDDRAPDDGAEPPDRKAPEDGAAATNGDASTPAAAQAPPPPLPDSVKTIDDAPVPVAEFGETGAAEEPGAEIHVDEPWEGYGRLTAAEVKGRLDGDATPELLAAVVLYEGLGKGRRSVIDAAERRLKRLTPPGS